MPQGYTYTLASTVAFLAAVDVPFPVELTALAMVGLVLRWALSRQNKNHDEHEERIAEMERRWEEAVADYSAQRHLKHAWRNEVTAMRATLGVLVPAAQRCSCGTMEPLIPVLVKLATDIKEPS